MNLPSTCINRPVLAIVMSITIVLFGAIGFKYLGVREFPSVDPPVITVVTNYTGANADVIESQITEPLEESISGIAGIRTISSVSREGRSTVTVEFDLNVDLEAAANDVRDKVSRAVSRLPANVDNPVVSKADANAVPIVFMGISSEKRDLLDISNIASTTFKERVQTIPGVSSVQVWGAKRFAMRLWLDPSKLAAYRLTPLDVRDALNRENVELPSGRIEGNFTELTVRTMGRLQTVQDFDNLVVKDENGIVIRFRDIGTAELGPENYRTILKRNGVAMVGIVLIPQPGANYISILNEFYKRVEQIKKDLPQDIELGLGFDGTKYIRSAILEVIQTIFVAFVLVVLVIFLFLRDWRTTIIPVITIPISLIGAFFIMYISNFSINILTLLGIVLAIGMVVDDAIVMLENIYSKIEQGMDRFTAGHQGAKEVYFAVIATTVALVAVFLPIMFLQGLTGRLFREFGIVIAGAVIISSFVALSLTPMISTRMLRREQKHSHFYIRTEPAFRRLMDSYRKTLGSFMEHRWLAFPIVAASVGMILLFGSLLSSELAPLEDRSSIMLFSSAQEGATFEYMDRYMDQLIATVEKTVPEHEAIVTVTSPGFGASSSVNSGFMYMILTPPEERGRSQQDVADQLNSEVAKLSGARTFVKQLESIGRQTFGLPLQYVLQAPNFEKLKKILPKFIEEARKHPEFLFVDADLKFNKPEIRVEIDRERARTLGISTLDIAQTLQLAFSGQRFGFFILNGKQYQVIGQVDREDRNDPLDLKSLFVRSKNGEIIQLDNVVNLVEQSSPPARYRFNRFVSATVGAALAKGVTIGDGIKVMDEIATKVLDDSFATDLAGRARDFRDSSSSLAFAFALALILIYLILAAQFESFRDPFIIMFTVPLALGGALAALWYFNFTINIFSQIGQIMLIGLVTKNGILIVEFANQRKQQGLSVMEAIQDAAVSRLRPVLMTSLSTILGILPIALALGAGSESRVSMGVAVIGGLLFASILTLYVVPAVYSYFSKDIQNVARPPQEGVVEEEPELVG